MCLVGACQLGMEAYKQIFFIFTYMKMLIFTKRFRSKQRDMCITNTHI